MGLQEIRNIKEQAKEPKIKKAYSIPRVSEKRKKRMEDDKQLLLLDKEVYLEIYAASPHTCQSCGCKLPKEPVTAMFHHLLEKRNYPAFRHVPENIIVVCISCHQQAETDISKVPKVLQRRKEVEKLLLT